MWGPCLSPPVAGHPLRPATDRRLGRLSPHQLANRTRAPPRAPPLAGWLSSAPPPGTEPTRYQRRFPGVVPRPGAGRPRAPHPSAANTPRRGRPLDLHALGTPPALILSQDQTLHQNANHAPRHPRAVCTFLPPRGRTPPPHPLGPDRDHAPRDSRTRLPPRPLPTLHLLNVPHRVNCPTPLVTSEDDARLPTVVADAKDNCGF